MKIIHVAVAAVLAAFAVPAQSATIYNGHSYILVDSRLNFAAANAAAKAAGGYLATITSAGEQIFLEGLVRDYVQQVDVVYIGGTDRNNEGTWSWTGGSEAGKTFFRSDGGPVDINFSNWFADEPNNSFADSSRGEQALVFGWDQVGQWNDIDENSTYAYVIETGGVPEPATWAMMIAGVGMTGGALRRRSTRKPALA